MDGSNSCEQQTKQKRGVCFSLVFGAAGRIFRLGCGLLALRAARALACATLPRKTDQIQRDPYGSLFIWCDRRDLNPQGFPDGF